MDMQVELRQYAAEFFARQFPVERLRRWAEGDETDSAETWTALAEMGWLGLCVPESQGGAGLGPAALAAVAVEAGSALAPQAFAPTALAGRLLARYGSPTLQQSLLPDLIAGKAPIAVAWGGPDDAWSPDAAPVAASAAADGRIRIDGAWRHVWGGSKAEWVLGAVRWLDGSLRFACLPLRQIGIAVTPMEDLIDPTLPLATLQVAGLPAGEEQLLAPLPPAPAAAAFWLLVAALAVGGAERTLQLAVQYAGERVQFGRPIGSFQAVKHHCANMLLRTRAAEALLWEAAAALEGEAPDAPALAAAAKAYATEAFSANSAAGIQVHGGIGFTWECPLHHYLRRAKALEFLFGSPAWHRDWLASWLATQPR